MRLKNLLPFIFFLLTGTLTAGDTALFKFLGFSPDGAFVAFSLEGVQDGSGFPYAELYVLNTGKNSYARSPLLKQWSAEEADSPTLQEVKKEWEKETLPVLKKWNIQSHHQGTRVSLETLQENKEWRFAHNGSTYDLSLVTRIFEKNCFDMGFNGEILNLEIRKGKKTQILQKDTRLPKSRGCAFGYEVSEVRVFQGFVAVAMAYKKPGFEGPDHRWMMITGKLP